LREDLILIEAIIDILQLTYIFTKPLRKCKFIKFRVMLDKKRHDFPLKESVRHCDEKIEQVDGSKVSDEHKSVGA
jgi:hypothetical protein